ncbi:MAG: carboxypeptidase-like regulatory domain-containing protein [Parafilimonas sp.]
MKVFLLIFLLIPFFSNAQVNWRHLQKRSNQTFVYNTNAATAEKFIKQDSINADAFLSQQPFIIFPSDSVDETKLPIGHYVLISIEDNRVVANLIGVSNLFVYTANNQHRVQLIIRDKQGNFIDNAKVWVNDKPVEYNKGSYFVKQKYPDEAEVKIYTPTDTLFASIWSEEELYKTVTEQRWENFKRSKFVNAITWIPKKIGNIFKNKSGYYYSNAGTGTIVFNQAKYKTTDTVKLKAYIFNKSWKQYKDAANVYLEYYADGKSNQQLLTTLKPSHPGSFIFQFPLSDTLINDINYAVVFRDTRHKKLLSNNFKIEDYFPDEISKFELRSSKEDYYSGDSMHFYVSATDANGLQLLDASSKLILIAEYTSNFYIDSIYIPDTLFVQEKPLLSEGETEFIFPADKLPDADIDIKANVILKNSNNELQQTNKTIKYRPGTKELLASDDDDSITVEYKMNGKSITANGLMQMEGEMATTDSVQFPLKIKVDPFATDYSFYVINNGVKTDSAYVQMENYYDVSLTRISHADTLGFLLNNPKKIPVSFSVFYGNSIITSGLDDKENIICKFKAPNKHRIYRVNWQYVWAGEEKTKEQTIALLYKILNIEVKSNALVYPGQKDSIHINVSDYKNKPAQNVNLTAVSYNSQLQNDIRISEPPYLVKYHNKQFLLHDKFEQDDGYVLNKYPLGKHIEWLQKFALDSVAYYKILFPKNEYKDVVTPITEYMPEVAVHVAKNGERKQIYLLYINKQLVYYNGVTDTMKQAYSCFPGYAKIGIRLYDKFIETDSIYIQPFYKHDIFIDEDKLPAQTVVTKMPEYFTDAERRLLENNIWQLDNNYTTNNAFVWQNDKLFNLSGSNKHIVGPFNKADSMHFFVRNNFDVHFLFESGYEYDISPKILRLEKKPLFPVSQKQIFLQKIKSPEWILGDTIIDPPVISYAKKVYTPSLKFNYYYNYQNQSNKGKIFFTVVKDTFPGYIILYPEDKNQVPQIANGNARRMTNINPGYYALLIVTKDFSVSQVSHVLIKANTMLCLHTEKYLFNKNNLLIDAIIKADNEPSVPVKSIVTSKPVDNVQQLSFYEKGKATISGKVTDKKGGNAIPFVTITVKGTRTAVAADANGNFTIGNIKSGKITLIFSSVGYASQEIVANAEDLTSNYLNITLEAASSSLNEVVVTGYGVSRKSQSLGYSLSITQQDLTSALQGKAAGISISNEGEPGLSNKIMIRGITSSRSEQNPLYVIDGILYDNMPSNITPDMLADVTVLKGSEAVALYGDKAANGVIIISTKLKNSRTQFRDYAFWQPEIFTDENGNASFVVTYPDNITGWQTYVLAMDKKRRIGKTVSYVKSYKPLSAQISMPQFLIEGDTVHLVGRLFNYSDDNYNINSSFTIYGNQLQQQSTMLQSKASQINKTSVVALAEKDSLKASFSLQTTTGFKDEEERKIPVLKKGTEETIGNFWVLQNDTTVAFKADTRSDKIELYAQNNTLDILLNEIEHLKQYPYFCNEQIASKLKGLLMEKKIKENLKQSFTEEKTIQFLLQKLQKAQLYDGGWSWWENDKSNIYITNYVVNALLLLRSNPLVETNIRNGLLYLQNQLVYLKKDELLTTLVTMSNAKHLIDYTSWIQKINYDSLTQYQQWLWIKLMQQQKFDYAKQLDTVLSKAIPGMLGSIHWGEENYRWYNDDKASTVIAFEVLQNEKIYDAQLKGIVQYFLEQRRHGCWTNTVQSASIVSALLSYILSLHTDFNKPAVLKVSGDTSFAINNYPFKTAMNANTIKNIDVTKSGGGISYLTLYQHYWNNNPEPVDSFFKLNTSFEKNGNKIILLTAGETTKMIVEVNALKEADYAMIEIPIPAGCTYADKKQDDWNVHKEFIKNKVVLFTEHIDRGLHTYTIELEPRYTGTYTINPAKASLMYFPTFYGRNEIKNVMIE